MTVSSICLTIVEIISFLWEFQLNKNQYFIFIGVISSSYHGGFNHFIFLNFNPILQYKT